MQLIFLHLKSNMDRFIDVTRLDVAYDDFHLKSNMDRFIVQNRNQSMFCIII